MTFKRFILAFVSTKPRRWWIHENVGFYLIPSIGFCYSNNSSWSGPQVDILIILFKWTIDYRIFDAACQSLFWD